MSLPKISIVIPSYNQGQFIERTIQSIISQNYPNLELILMDGGSTDNTMEVVEKYREHFAHIQSGKDGGQTAAIAAGFERATGAFLSWLNSDDTYNAGSLLQVGAFLEKNPSCNFVYGNCNIIDDKDELISFKRSILAFPFIMKTVFLSVPQMSAFWSKSLYQKAGGMDVNLRFCMDRDLLIKLAQLERPRRINVTIGQFRMHSSNKSSTLEHVRLQEDELLTERYSGYNAKKNPIRVWAVRAVGYVVLVLLMIENGSLWLRIWDRTRNGFKSHSK